MRVALVLCVPCALAIQQPRDPSIKATARLRGGARSNSLQQPRAPSMKAIARLRGGARSNSTHDSVADGINSLQYLKKRESSSSRGLAVLIPLYVQAAKSWASTVGEPYRKALEVILALEVKADPNADVDSLFNSLEEFAEGGGHTVAGVYVPLSFLPSVSAVLLLFGTATAHALFLLMQRWSVHFRVSCAYEKLLSPIGADAVLLTPEEGSACICPLLREGADDVNSNPISAVDAAAADDDSELAAQQGALYFTYQRRKFVLSEPADSSSSGSDEQQQQQQFKPVSLPVDLPLQHYLLTAGLSPAEVQQKRLRYGLNSVRLPPQTLMDSFKQSVLSPISIFGLFSQVSYPPAAVLI
jgi:hypothetical protein